MAKSAGQGTRGNGAQGTIAQRAAQGITTLIARAGLNESDFTAQEVDDLKKSAAAAIRADKRGVDTTYTLAGIDGFINRRAESKPKASQYGVNAKGEGAMIAKLDSHNLRFVKAAAKTDISVNENIAGRIKSTMAEQDLALKSIGESRKTISYIDALLRWRKAHGLK